MNTMVIGGAGFIGVNLAYKLLQQGEAVTVVDNFSRTGTRANVSWLETQTYSGRLIILGLDIRSDWQKICQAIDQYRIDAVYHLAAQVAVTTSVLDPREDFEINALGTFNVLEAVRLSQRKPLMIYASTNKVFGGMEDIKILQGDKRYSYQDFPLGIPESRVLDFHSPYGCSKGAADQYVRDYGRIYGLKTVVFRQSCIYGPRQMGVEDQGWVAWFTIAAILGKQITIYGDGKQVRDVLFVDDLVAAYLSATNQIHKTAGQIFNIGGGPEKTLSLLELIDFIETFLGQKIEPIFADWRPGDQPVFIADIRKAKNEFDWQPKVSPREGVERLFNWVKNNQELFTYIEHNPIVRSK